MGVVVAPSWSGIPSTGDFSTRECALSGPFVFTFLQIKRRRVDDFLNVKIAQWKFIDREFETKLLLCGKSPTQNHSWVTWDGIPVQGGETMYIFPEDILKMEHRPGLSTLRLRDPEKFVAGGIHAHSVWWERILEQHPKRDVILSWLSEGVNVLDFTVHFSGFFKGVQYDSSQPPSKIWPNHALCKKFHNLCTCRISPSFDMCSTLVFRP